MLPNTFTFTAVSPDGFYLKTELERLQITTEDGDIEVLPGHDSLLSTLSYSKAKAWTSKTEAKELILRQGMVAVNRDTNTVRVMAFSCDYTADISLQTLEEYYKQLETELAKGDLSPSQFQYLQEQSASLKQMMEVSKPKA